MPVTTERLPRSLVALTIEVEEGRLEASMSKAVQRVSEQVKIPGFRPGKAPRAIVERTVGRPALLQEALDQLLPDLYREAIESEAIEAIGEPEFELESMEPVVVHAKVPVRPTVELNDYRSLRAPRPEEKATPEQVEESLTALRQRFATLEPVDRAAQWGDSVRADVRVVVEGRKEPPHVGGRCGVPAGPGTPWSCCRASSTTWSVWSAVAPTTSPSSCRTTSRPPSWPQRRRPATFSCTK